MPLDPHTKFGPYEIVSPLGAGGMGEVYRARDGRLGRDVAIKVLPASFASDAERLRRFEQEARAAGALNHPNVLAIYDIGTDIGTGGGAPYLVTELLEGETLRERLNLGPIPLRKALEIAIQAAHGVAAAHEKGIIHRDLKPANIFLTHDGRVKILDFGLAKLTQRDASGIGETQAATRATMDAGQTEAGLVLGTVGYMSPEQVRGKPADARSDIFALGTILYEMLSGQRAFEKESSADTMAAILKEEPPELSGEGKKIPPAVERIVRHCLEKNPAERFQSARDLAFDLESLSSASTTTASAIAAAPQNGRKWLVPVAAVAAILILAVAGAWWTGRLSPAKGPLKFTRLTYQKGYPSNARFAKDGHTVVYSAQWEDDPLRIYSVRREFPQSAKVELPSAALLDLNSSGDVELALEPVYHANFLSGTLAQAQMAGGTPRGQEKEVIAADYAPDGTTLAVARLANRKVQLEYPEGKVIYSTSGYTDYVRISPDGKQVAFLEHPVYEDDRGWVAVIDAAGNHKQLTKEFGTAEGLAWSRTGAEIWFTAGDQVERNMYGVSLSGKLREIFAGPQSVRLLDIAPDGRVLLSGEQSRAELTGNDPATGKERRGLEWFDGSGTADISPDGKAILFMEWGGPADPLYLVVYRKLDGSAPVALGTGARPRFSPDGTTAAAILYTRPPQVALHPIGTGESRRLSVGNIVNLARVAWFPDGKHLLLTGAAEGEAVHTYQMDLEGGKPQPLGPADFTGVAVAKDGKRIAGWNASGQMVVFDLGTQKVQTIPGIGPQEALNGWTADGQALLVSSSTPWEAWMYRVDMATGKRTLLQKIEMSDKAGSTQDIDLHYSEGSKTYVYGAQRILGSLYMVEGLE
jgi:eukaryotic-like serine/threonine-protein kinase